MSLPGGDKIADVGYDRPTHQARASLDQAWDWYDLGKKGSPEHGVRPTDHDLQAYLQNDLFTDTSGYARTRGAAAAGGAVGDMREKISPMMMNRGLGASGISSLAKAQGAGMQAVNQAGVGGEVDIMNRGLNAAKVGLRGMSGVSTTSLQGAGAAESASRSMANADFERNMQNYQDQAALTNQLAGLAATYAGGVGKAQLTQPDGVAKGGSVWNPTNWYNEDDRKYNQGSQGVPS